MMEQKFLEFEKFQEKCDRLLEQEEIRFAGLINDVGRLVVGDFKEGIMPLADNTEMQKMYMELALRVAMRKEFDYTLGDVKYCASRREKAVMISIPIDNNILLVSAETHADIDKLGNKMMKIIGKT